jgi:hypothetical protein
MTPAAFVHVSQRMRKSVYSPMATVHPEPNNRERSLQPQFTAEDRFGANQNVLSGDASWPDSDLSLIGALRPKAEVAHEAA